MIFVCYQITYWLCYQTWHGPLGAQTKQIHTYSNAYFVRYWLLWGLGPKAFSDVAVEQSGRLGVNTSYRWLNTLRPRRNEHFADDIFKRIFFNENVWISIKISLKSVPKGPINNIPALVQIMAWRRPGDKPLSEAMMINLPTHICVSRPQWGKATLQYHQYVSTGDTAVLQ